MKIQRLAFTALLSLGALGASQSLAAWETKTFGTSRTIRAVQFAGPDTGWAVGDSGTVLRTVDGGETWTAQAVDTSVTLNGIHVLNGTTAWALGGPQAFLFPASRYLFRTINAGQTWTRLDDTAAYPPQGSNGFRYHYEFTALNFSTPDSGWAGVITAMGSTSFEAGLLKTTNGGATWTKARINTSGGAIDMGRIRFHAILGRSPILYSAAGHHVVNGQAGGNPGYYCYSNRSHDAGATWTTVSLGPNLTSSACPNLADARASFLQGDTMWYSDSTGRIWRSTDGSVSWIDSSAHARVTRSIHFRGALGYAVGDSGAMLRSTNGGATWTPQRSGTAMNLLSVQVASPMVAYALTSDNKLLRGDPSVSVRIAHAAPPDGRRTRLTGGTFRYVLPYATHVRLTVRDAQGRETLTLRDAAEAPGSHDLPLKLEALAPGAYLLDFRAGGIRESWPLIKKP